MRLKRILRYMLRGQNKYRSMQASMTAFVFTLMAWSAFLSGAFMFTLRAIFGFTHKFSTPTALIVVSMVVSCIIGTLLSGVIGSIFLKPVEKVIKAMRRVEKGDYTVRVDDSDTAGAINDLVTSYNKMAQELGGVEIFREDFINSFSHEFKTPIVSIEGFAKQLKKDSVSEQKKQEYIDIIIAESKRLTALSSNILLLSKLENQQILADKTEISLDEQIRDCILLLEKQWSAKSIEFDIDMEEITFETNADMLSQAWVNIIGNAVKFSPQESVIRISLKRVGGEIRAEISDRGIGIKKETISHIFERFYQGDSAHSAEGNGLGLPLVKRIIELNHGKIRVESQYGHGTTFIVTLPEE